MAISSADRKRHYAREAANHTEDEPPLGFIKAEKTKKKVAEEKLPIQDNIVNPYNKEICQLCDYAGRERGEWYCYQDEPIVRCNQIMNCSRYHLDDESVTTTFLGREENSKTTTYDTL